ncbi:MAG: sigma-54 dependent transcriptional regulator [Deltaproteobacteria bacterium]
MANEGDRILIVDDEKDFRDILFHLLRMEGFSPLVAHEGERALEMVKLGMPDLVLLDVRMPGMDGMEVLKRAKRINPDLPIIMVTAYGGVDGAIRAIKLGAEDYLTKPLDNNELMAKVKGVLAQRVSKPRKPAVPQREDSTAAELRAKMGPSDWVGRIIADTELVARSNFTVVIQGETGTGKELVAQAIHKASTRASAPMVPVDCGAIPETLFESELFGHEKGAFTGAAAAKPGKFELAEGGTLFLDEIANMPLNSQVKLLRAIQEKNFFRVGGKKPVTIDVRLLVATNQDLNAAVKAGRFGRDLFYRLNEFAMVIPPLRQRTQDIPYLANRFLEATNRELDKQVKGFSDSALSALLTYKWPGNVRQLKSVVRRAVLKADEAIEREHLQFGDPAEVTPETQAEGKEFLWEGQSLKEIVRGSTIEIERRVLTQVLRKVGGNKAKAARLLQIDYKTIHSKVKQYGITLEEDPDDNR